VEINPEQAEACTSLLSCESKKGGGCLIPEGRTSSGTFKLEIEKSKKHEIPEKEHGNRGTK
jgi:hypothetical protein